MGLPGLGEVDGAFSGEFKNLQLVQAVAEATPFFIELGGGLRTRGDRCARGDRRDERGKFADHCATPFLAASSGFPMGTMEIMTRLAWRYLWSTRCTSDAVTAR